VDLTRPAGQIAWPRPRPLNKDPNIVDKNPYQIPNHIAAGTSASQRKQFAAILRVGRVLLGQVVETFGEGCFLVRVGRHRFSLQSDLCLLVGQSFHFRVEKGRQPDELNLTILSDPGLTEFRLHDALRMVLRQDAPLGDLLIGLAESLVYSLARQEDKSGACEGLLDRLEDHLLQPGADGLELADVLNRIGLGYEANLLRAGALSDDIACLLEIDRDLKGELLGILADDPNPKLRSEVERALAGLEAEQVLQIARQVEGDPNHWTFPVRDGDRWVCASLFVKHREPEEGDPLGTPIWRVTIGIAFESLGPVRVDFTFGKGGVSMRVLVSDQEMVGELQTRARGLQDQIAEIIDMDIGRDFLPARVSVFAASAEDIDVSRRHLDIGFLRKRKVLDLRG
jgi:hypothetical protein